MPDEYGICNLNPTVEVPSTGDEVDDDEDEEDEMDEEEIIDSFLEDHCHGCEYYFETEETEDFDYLTDRNGNQIISAIVESRCSCHAYSLRDVSFPCVAGHDDPFENPQRHRQRTHTVVQRVAEFALPPMGFAQDFAPETMLPLGIRAWTQAVDWNAYECWMGSRYGAINVFGSELICWGSNSYPESLPEAVVSYKDGTANDDLMSVSEFHRITQRVRQEEPGNPITTPVITAGYNAALLVTAQASPQAYLMLRASGIPSAGSGVLAVGLSSCAHTLEDGSELQGYVTAPVNGGLCWLVIPAPFDPNDPEATGGGLLLGQIPNPIASAPCPSPAPSSSELAAPVAG